jgi:hypothetical protein
MSRRLVVGEHGRVLESPSRAADSVYVSTALAAQRLVQAIQVLARVNGEYLE